MEYILALRREDLFTERALQGFSGDPALVAHFMQRVVERAGFVPRGPAEVDEGWKQVVPYGVALCRGQVYCFERLPQGREAGLRGLESVGLGGHVDRQDGLQVDAALLERALLREISEEVALDRPRPGLWGVLNDERNPVGRRHFGFVYRVVVNSPVGRSREPDKIRGRFVSLETARSRYGQMESWSQIVLEALLS
ncbi:MAG: hypothetical protein JXA37_08640 [Chloroflexia bacterium]|nr:hypothetical protein [Chloroflexia bacterium]